MISKFLSLILLCSMSQLFAQDGTLDSTFGGTGIVVTDFDPLPSGADNNNLGRSVAVDPEGRIVVAGFTSNVATSCFSMLRYLPSGTLDSSFSNDGIFTLPKSPSDGFSSVFIDSNGKIYAAGTHFFSFGTSTILMRINDNGTVDSTFGFNGQVVDNFSSDTEIADDMERLGDDKLIIAGSVGDFAQKNFFLTCYNLDGSLVNSFGNNGTVVTDIKGVRNDLLDISTNGESIVAVGASYLDGDLASDEMVVVKYHLDGTLDNSFGTNGIVSTSFNNTIKTGKAVSIFDNDKILIATGNSMGNLALIQYNPDGNLDPTFGISGQLSTDFYGSGESFNSIIPLPDCKFAVTGSADRPDGFPEMAIAKYLPDGHLDSSFGTNGKASTDWQSGHLQSFAASRQPDGKIVLTGNAVEGNLADMAVARFINSTNSIEILSYVDDAICDATGSIDLSVSGGSGSYIYEWENGETTEDLTGIAPGTYTVTVYSCQLSTSTTFTVKDLEDAKPTSLTLSDKTHCSVQLNWNGSSSETSFEVRYREIGGVFSSPIDVGFNTSYQFSGLLPLTQYTFEVRSKCTVTGAVSSWVKKSAKTVACGLVLNLVSSAEATTATIYWNDPCETNKYLVRYRKAGISNWSSKSSTVQNILLTGLLPSTLYEYQVKTYCQGVTSSFTPIHTFTTEPMRMENFGVSQSVHEAITIYPNPSSSLISVTLKGFSEGSIHLSVIHSITQNVLKSQVMQLASGNRVEVEIEDLAEGVYFLKAVQGEKVLMDRFVVIR